MNSTRYRVIYFICSKFERVIPVGKWFERKLRAVNKQCRKWWLTVLTAQTMDPVVYLV